MQQRAIRADALELLFEYGREAFDHRGGVVLYFDKAARRRLQHAAPRASGLERIVRCYAVVSTGGKVITVGHRSARIIRV
jgi:hypothetical protein